MYSAWLLLHKRRLTELYDMQVALDCHDQIQREISRFAADLSLTNMCIFDHPVLLLFTMKLWRRLLAGQSTSQSGWQMKDTPLHLVSRLGTVMERPCHWTRI